MNTLSKELSVLVGSILGSLRASALQGNAVSLVLHALRSNESLNLGGFGVWFGALLLGGNLTTDDELAGCC